MKLLTKRRGLVKIPFEQLEALLGLETHSIRSIYASPEDECLMVITDDERIGFTMAPGSHSCVQTFHEYPIKESYNVNSNKEKKTP